MTDKFLDTNCLARLILKDNLEQHNSIVELITQASRDGFYLHINVQVIIELIYVLSKIYSVKKSDIVDSIENILNSTTIQCNDFETVYLAISIWKQKNLSIEDCYYISYCLDKKLEFFSFDHQAKKIFESIKVA
jgi:predicted nucleic-acid-binding protein